MQTATTAKALIGAYFTNLARGADLHDPAEWPDLGIN
jgi:hypothetical protein